MNTHQDTFRELTTDKEWREAFPIINQLRTNLTLEAYLQLIQEMNKQGYRLFALYDEEMVALAGIQLNINFYHERYVFIHDLVTDSSHRSKGYGEILLHFIHDWASERGAQYVSLESGIQRREAHRFYEEKMDYEKWCYSFRRKL